MKDMTLSKRADYLCLRAARVHR